MKHLLALACLVIPTSGAFGQSFGTLSAIPSGTNIALSWGSSPSGTNTVQRSAFGVPGSTTTIGTTAGATFTDTTAVVNTVYVYQVVNGASQTNPMRAAISDMTLPFNCPPMQQIPAPKLGVDRTESFEAANGDTISFTVQVPVTTSTVMLSPCNGAVGCSDFTNIDNALKVAGTAVHLAAGDYHLNNPSWSTSTFNYNIMMTANDTSLIGDAGHTTDAKGHIIPLTRVLFNQTPSTIGAVQGLVVGLTNRTLVRDIQFDRDFRAAIPGVVHNVVGATFTGTIAAGGPPNAGSGILTVSSVTSGALANDQYIYDASGAIGSWARIYPGGTGTGGTGTYNLTYGINPSTNVSTPTVMTAVSSQRFTVNNPSYYIPDPTNPPTLKTLDGYRLSNYTYDFRGGARVGIVPTATGPNGTGFNSNFASDGLYYYNLSGGFNLPDGTEAVLFVKTAGCIDIGSAATNSTFENVACYGGGGTGLIVGSQSSNVRLSNIALTRKPDSALASGEQPRYVSFVGDSDSAFNYGNILIENSDFGFQDDDDFWMRGLMVKNLTSLTSTTGFTLDTTFQYPMTTGVGNTIKFIDPNTYAEIGRTIGSFSQSYNAGTGIWTWTVTYPSVPELTPYIGLTGTQLPAIAFPGLSSPNVIIRDSCFHDNHGRILAYNENVLIENNVFGNNYYGPIEMSWSFNTPSLETLAGSGSSNIIVRNNSIVGVGGGDFSHVWDPLSISNGAGASGWNGAAIFVWGTTQDGGFSPSGFPFKNLQISNNFITNAAGLCITLISADTASVTGNDCVNNNTEPFIAGFDTTYCGTHSQGGQADGAGQPWCLSKTASQQSIFVAHSKNVDTTSTPNTFAGSTVGGVFTADTTLSVPSNYIFMMFR
jgi:hypothetical protein